MPARHRELLTAMDCKQLTITKHPEGALLVFPRPAWEAFRDRVAAFPADGETLEALLRMADRRLYAAKAMGRARVHAHGGPARP